MLPFVAAFLAAQGCHFAQLLVILLFSLLRITSTIPSRDYPAVKSNDSKDASASPPEPFRLSAKWDIYIPFTITAIPASFFVLMGLVINNDLRKPPGIHDIWVPVTIVVLQTLGGIAMAVVILMRYEIGFQQLSIRTNGSPAIWRKAFLFCSIASILLFDILTNLVVAFPDAGLMLFPAALAFIGYIFCLRVAFSHL